MTSGSGWLLCRRCHIKSFCLRPLLLTFEAVAHIDWELRYYWTKGSSRSFFYFAITTRILGHFKARLINLCEGHALSSQFFLVKSAVTKQFDSIVQYYQFFYLLCP